MVATLSQQSFSLLPNPWQSSPSSTGFLLGPLQEEQGWGSGSPCWTPNAVNSPFVLAGQGAGEVTSAPLPSLAGASSASPQQGTGQSVCSKQVDYSYFEEYPALRTPGKLLAPWKGDMPHAPASPPFCPTDGVHVSLVFQCLTF